MFFLGGWGVLCTFSLLRSIGKTDLAHKRGFPVQWGKINIYLRKQTCFSIYIFLVVQKRRGGGSKYCPGHKKGMLNGVAVQEIFFSRGNNVIFCKSNIHNKRTLFIFFQLKFWMFVFFLSPDNWYSGSRLCIQWLAGIYQSYYNQ